MLSFNSVNYSNVNKSNRFDAKYFNISKKLEKYSKRKDIEIKNLGDESILKVITDGEHAGQVFVNSGVLFIKNSSVKDFEISLNEGFYITEKNHERLNRSSLKKEDILFTTIGHLGSATIVPESIKQANINQNLVKLEVCKDIINPYYLAVYLNSSIIKEQINCIFTGNIHGILTYPKIKSLKVIIPSKEIQKDIEVQYKKVIQLEEESRTLLNKAKNILNEALKMDKFNSNNENIYTSSFNKLNSRNIWNVTYHLPKYENLIKYLKANFKCKTLKELTTIKRGKEVGSDNYNTYIKLRRMYLLSEHQIYIIIKLINFQIFMYP